MLKSLAILVFSTLTIGNPGKENTRANLAQYERDNRVLPAVFFPRDEASAPDSETADTGPPRWYTLPEWWLCILGVPTLIFIGWQAKTTADSAKATRDSALATQAAATAALKQANVAMEAERAWVVVKLNYPLDYLPRQAELQGRVIVVSIKIENVGKQPALIRNARFRFHPASKLADEPQYLTFAPPDEIGFHGRILVPGEPLYAPVTLVSGSLDDDQINAIAGQIVQRFNLYVYGRIDYESMGVKGINQFGYRWDNCMGFALSSDKPGFRRAGLPSAYNFQS